jgi:hypothetical protein
MTRLGTMPGGPQMAPGPGARGPRPRDRNRNRNRNRNRKRRWAMNDETFNLEIRKFLKKFGVSAQRAIEDAVRDGLESGHLAGDATLRVEARLTIRELDAEHTIDDEIRLE